MSPLADMFLRLARLQYSAGAQHRGERSDQGQARHQRVLAEGLHKEDQHVNAISPGSIETPGLNGLLASSETGTQRKQIVESVTPVGRFGTPDEIAKAVVFLASDDSSYVTGMELFVSGGFGQV